VQASDPNISCGALAPKIGIAATPVIDRSAGANGTMFVVAFSTNGKGGYFHCLHAIDLSTGKDRTGIGPVIISASTPPNTRPANTFNPTKQLGRPGLLLLNGAIYTTWASYCDNSVTGQRAIWLLHNGAYQSSFSLPTVSTNWRIAGVADFDGDGQADLVWENTSTGQRSIWLLKNGIFQSSYLLPTASTQWHIVDH
jgi:hypothetical protein